jgi:membrane protein HdeD
VSPTKFSAAISFLLGVAAIILPYLVGTVAVMILGGVMLASGIVSLLYVNAVRKQGFPVGVIGPWVKVLAGVIILIWPGLALWIVAVILGGGLVLSGISGLTALRDSGIVNPPVLRKIELWSSIVLGVLLIVLGAAGSAILLGMVLGVALISSGVQQWRFAI